MMLFLAGADAARCQAEMAGARIGEADAAARALGRGIEVGQSVRSEYAHYNDIIGCDTGLIWEIILNL
jgi:hypothetical protein